MNIDSCLNIENFKEQLINLVNNCNLTIGTALYIVKDIHNSLYNAYLEELRKESHQLGESEVETLDVPVEDLINGEKEIVNNVKQNND